MKKYNIMNIEKYGPALKVQSEYYPASWHSKVPKKIKMAKTVTSSSKPFYSINNEPTLTAENDKEYECWVNSHGAVAAIMPDGRHLGLKPYEFEIIEWHKVA